jgi:zinc transport system substrate-binding protein
MIVKNFIHSTFFRKLSSLVLLFFSFLLSNPAYADVPTVLVSVAPHQFFVEKIAKGTVQVQLMVPAGASAHTYEPTARQMMTAAKAEMWFRIGEPFENKAIAALKSHHPSIEIVDLRQGLDLISHDRNHPGGGGCSCCPGAVDLHFWLSARQAEIQAKTIADTLSKTYPGYANFYQSNLLIFKQELKELDEKIIRVLASLKNRRILVSHPAYAYFCRDYDLEQFSIEVEGKDPSPQQMTKLLCLARQYNFRTIFIQMQYNNKAAKLVAETLGARLIVLDPYSEQYLSSMLEIADAFAEQ